MSNPKVEECTRHCQIKSPIARGNVSWAVSFANVSFSYPVEKSRMVLNDVTFSAKPGQNIAIVGSSGSGKSTIVALLERFFEPDAGMIAINGRPVNECCTDCYRQHVSLVSQDVVLLEGSLRENILLGADEETTQASLEQACRDADIHDFIASLPDGYETLCGQRGANFSGGQRQRISIARALIRRPKMLLLDEATSALDSGSETKIQGSLQQSQEDRVTMTVAHRFYTVKNANRILVVSEGRVREQGTHSELWRKKGLYWSMFRLQELKESVDGRGLEVDG